jgi:transcriptional regulator with XRE-family HTH domain
MQKERNDFNYMKLRIQERLDGLLAEKDISRRELAKRIDISEDYLGKMMRGLRDWKVEYLKKVADGLDVPLEDILSDSLQLPVAAEIGVGKDIDSVSFDYKAVVSPKKDRSFVPFPDLPKSQAAATYVVKTFTGTELMPGLLPGSHLFITRGLANADDLKDGQLAVYVDDKTDRGYICRIERAGPHFLFHSLFTPPGLSSKDASGTPAEIVFKKLADNIMGIDIVVAIVFPRPPRFEVRS